ncbi:hypothetical protein DBIPINDM_003328 [Mesorhizobium sp. AR02]|uniref:hypothetical protein n=1 Tax=Mesorhizobium sp. AR02 TaxID=2865837 RepID=UPI00215F4B47|nr:hypothetical protein [Mesorhizobium sp. AR02]UVK56706.1 hypothetical protein DBIPINDM_003328 [Mesorhizobium sp. AR02]
MANSIIREPTVTTGIAVAVTLCAALFATTKVVAVTNPLAACKFTSEDVADYAMKQAWQVLKGKTVSPNARDLTTVEIFEIASINNVNVESVSGDKIRCSGSLHVAAKPLQQIIEEVGGGQVQDVDMTTYWTLTPNEKGGFHIITE